ncbi:MAG: hypothetical protein ACOC8A_00065 [bacterium]
MMRKQEHVLAMVLGALVWATGPALADKEVLITDYNMEVLRCKMPEEGYRLGGSNAPFQLFFPDEPVNLELYFNDAPQKCAIEIQGIHTRTPDKVEGRHVDPYGAPDRVTLDGPPIRVEIGARAGRFEVHDLPLPERFGTYALVLVRDGTRQFLATACRLRKPRPEASADNTPITIGASLIRKETPDAAKAIARMGIRLLRSSAGDWQKDQKTGEYKWERSDGFYKTLEEAGLKTYPLVAPKGFNVLAKYGKGRPIPATGTAWYWANSDWNAAPEDYPEWGQWITAFCQRYRKGGQGALWGLELYNEPWEGGGISGWARDMLEYRKMFKIMATSARKVDPGIQMLGCSSSMNTEDKLYSDGSDEFDEYLDVMTEHYAQASYGTLVAARHGKRSINNECWTVINEYLLPVIMARQLADGQFAATPFHPNTVFTSPPGTDEMVPNPVVAAVSAFNYFVTGKAFQGLAFTDHLPWVFQFGRDDDPEGLLIVFGQLMSLRADDPAKDARIRPWPQVEADKGGEMTIDNRDRLLRFYDAAGNPTWEDKDTVTMPMSYLPVYVRCERGPAAAIERIRQATISGDKRPVEILPRDFTTRVDAQGAALQVELHNCYNRAIEGTLRVDAPETVRLAPSEPNVRLEAGGRKTLSFPIAEATPAESNNYPFRFAFASDAGDAQWSETLHAAVAVRGSRKVDGDLADWEGVPGITVVAGKEEIDPDLLAKRPWTRWREKEPDGTYGEVKLAWDDEFVYVAARVNDPTPQFHKLMLEGRNDDAFFHSAESDIEPKYASVRHTHPGFSFAEVPYVYKHSPNSAAAAPWSGDRLQLAFDVRDDWHDLEPVRPTNRPEAWQSHPDTDYEFAFYLVTSRDYAKIEQWEESIYWKNRRLERRADALPEEEKQKLRKQIRELQQKIAEYNEGEHLGECWTLLTPHTPRIHDYPRQPKKPPTTGPTEGIRKAIVQHGSVRIYELAIPRTRLPEFPAKAGETFGFQFHIGNDDGPGVTFGEGKAVCGKQSLTFHPYWWTSASQGVRWGLVE